MASALKLIGQPLKLLSFALYAACLLVSPYCSGDKSLCSGSFLKFDFGGLSVLTVGWLAPLASVANMSWLANPFLWICWGTDVRKHQFKAIIFGILSFAFSLLFYFNRTVMDNESGVPSIIVSYRAGYWLWLASIAATNLGLLFQTPDRKTVDLSAA